jgi:tellurite resistance protein TerC
MLKGEDEEFNPKDSFVFRQIKKVYPITTTIHDNNFFIRRMGIKAATPLFVALIIIELTDILFALDSIPAILAITADPFIVFSSNILAILGLRSMYFLISRMLAKFRYINYSLVVILGFVGIKMLLVEVIHFPEWVSLSVIAVALIGGVLASLYIPEDKEKEGS